MKVESVLAPAQQEICRNILRTKHALSHESAQAEVFARVARALSNNHGEQSKYLATLHAGFVGGGRIMKGATQEKNNNLVNCFVQPIADTVTGSVNGKPGIFKALEMAAETLRKGGGVGYDFSEIRPKGALVASNSAEAAGPLPFMKMFGSLAATLKSEDGRESAQMAVLRVDHPDIYDFINAKRGIDLDSMSLTKDQAQTFTGLMSNNANFARRMNAIASQLSAFNLSVAVTDEFMLAVQEDSDFDLVHTCPPSNLQAPTKLVDGKLFYVYATIRAKELWSQILWNTYTGAEPGVLFIDTVNNKNNLHYIEKISASNPCGEQMLPPNGCCDVGSWNLSQFVLNPFTKYACFDYMRLEALVPNAVQILDRVLDKTVWPHPEQESEAMSKRRIGMGFFALADTFAMLGVRYGSPESIAIAEKITQTIAHAAYLASVELAKEHGPFPLFIADEYLAEGTYASTLPQHIQDEIREHGIRNSHLLSIAPTGTIALSFGNNASSGCEPIFSLTQKRYIHNNDGTRSEVFLDNAAYHFAKKMGSTIDPAVWATAESLTVEDHLAVLQAVAKHIDSAVSKTVNIPEAYDFDDFSKIYLKAYNLGLKGLTTYRPNHLTGSVLEPAEKKSNCSECDDGVCPMPKQ